MKINDNTSNTSPTLHGKSFTSNIKLGLYFDSNLSRKYLIDYFCHKKSNTTVGIIAKIRHFVPHHVLLCVYPALSHFVSHRIYITECGVLGVKLQQHILPCNQGKFQPVLLVFKGKLCTNQLINVLEVPSVTSVVIFGKI